MAEREKAEEGAGVGAGYAVDMPTAPAERKSPARTSGSSSSAGAALPAALTGPGMSILSYCVSSILMTVTNKFVVSGSEFNMNFLLLMVQSLVCILAIQTAKWLRLITYRDFNLDEARKWLPISLLLIVMIYTASKALQYLTIPVYTIFKNLTIILIAYGEVLWFGGSVSRMALCSFALMVLSSVVAAWADITAAVANFGHDGEQAAAALSTLNAGYVWMLVNCLSCAAYVLGMRKRIKLTNFKDFDTMFYNNLLSIPVLLLCSLTLEDWTLPNRLRNFPPATRTSLLAAMIFSGLSTVLISYTSAWCIRATSSTTYSMVGALNKLPVALSGLVFFDAPVTFGSVSAILIGFVAGLVYALAGIRAQKRKSESGGMLPTSSSLPISASQMSVRDGLQK